jgi:hypothetical protein
MNTSTRPRPNLDISQPAATRRPRFRRDDPLRIRLTDDDIAIMRHVAKHRFLRSTHLITLLDRPVKKVLERLAALYQNGYLDRPRQQLDYYAIAGSAPLVYALGNKGAARLVDRGEMPLAKVDWTDKNRTVGRVFIEHSLMIADVMTALECAIRQRTGVRLILPGQILAGAPAETQRAQNPWKLRATVSYAGTTQQIGIIPDKVFGLDFTGARKRSYFFLEADRATMPVTRSHPRQTSFNQKIFGYLAGGGTGNAHGTQFGIGNFRVLTVTTSPQRMQTMFAAQKAATRGEGLASIPLRRPRQAQSLPRRVTGARSDALRSRKGGAKW